MTLATAVTATEGNDRTVSASTNPILPGFYPDPSICRADDVYYLANSSFEYFPGVPLWKSEDFLTWTQLGNILERPAQMPPGPVPGSAGIYAPTLRHHDGRFWLITTNTTAFRNEQIILTAVDPAGPWSDPVITTGVVGIDPDLAWDGDDCFVTWAAYDEANGSRIVQTRIDTATGEAMEEPRPLWSGSGMKYPEAPHLYKRGDWWYLLIAEGGTETGHAVSIARSRRPEGPYQPAPENPILSHRSTIHSVQNTGHADLVERPDGTWAMVYLAVRPRGSNPFHVNGRETFIAGVTWVDDWPEVDNDAFTVPAIDTSFTDAFDAPTLDPRWVSPGDYPDRFTERDARPGLLIPAAVSGGSPRLFSYRTRDAHWTSSITIDVSSGGGRFIVRMDDNNWFGLEITPGHRCGAVAALSGTRVELGWLPRVPTDPIELLLESVPARTGPIRSLTGPDTLRASVVLPEGPVLLGELDGRYLSTEVAGGFTGRVVGVQATDGTVRLHRIGYTAASS